MNVKSNGLRRCSLICRRFLLIRRFVRKINCHLGVDYAPVLALFCPFSGCLDEHTLFGAPVHRKAQGGAQVAKLIIMVSNNFYSDDTFQNNGTAVLRERVSGDATLKFPGSRFTGNDTDIDNRCDQPLDLSEAIFE